MLIVLDLIWIKASQHCLKLEGDLNRYQKHEFDEYLYFMYKEFRFMVNEAIRIGHRVGAKDGAMIFSRPCTDDSNQTECMQSMFSGHLMLPCGF